MSDFYKGYFDDRYSFAHSDKKWYDKNRKHVREYNHNYYEAHKKVDTKNRFYKGNTSDMNQNPSKAEFDEMELGTIYTQDGKYCVKSGDGSYGEAKDLRSATEMSKAIVKRQAEKEGREKDEKIRQAGDKIDALADRFGNKRKKTMSASERAQKVAADKDRYRKEIAAGQALHLTSSKERKEMSATEKAQKLASERRRWRV